MERLPSGQMNPQPYVEELKSAWMRVPPQTKSDRAYQIVQVVEEDRYFAVDAGSEDGIRGGDEFRISEATPIRVQDEEFYRGIATIRAFDVRDRVTLCALARSWKTLLSDIAEPFHSGKSIEVGDRAVWLPSEVDQE